MIIEAVLDSMSTIERRALCRFLHRLIDLLDKRFFDRDLI